VTFTATEAAPTYTITLSETTEHDFGEVTYGYAQQSALTVTITNTGNQATGALAVALSGDDDTSFVLSETSISSILAGGTGNTDTFTVRPANDLEVGVYEATVTVTGGNGIEEDFDVTFEVTPKALTITGVYATTRYYNQTDVVALTGGSLVGVINQDDVGFTLGTGLAPNKNAGTDLAVTTPNIQLTGDDRHNYTLTLPTYVRVTINRIQLTWNAAGTVNNKTYNRTNAATIATPPGLVGVLSSDDVSATGNVVFENIYAGVNKTVTATTGWNILTGDDASNYYAPTAVPVFANATINRVQLSWNTGGTVHDKEWDGETDALVDTEPTLNGIVSGDTVNVAEGTVEFDSSDVGNGITITASGWGIKEEYAYANYDPPIAQPVFAPANITNAEIPAISNYYRGIRFTDTTGQTLDLSTFVDSNEFPGTQEYFIASITDGSTILADAGDAPEIAGNTLSFQLASGLSFTANTTATIVIRIEGFDFHDDITFNVIVRLTELDPADDVIITAPTSITYGEALDSPSASSVLGGDDFFFAYRGRYLNESTDFPARPEAPTNPGTFYVIATLNSATHDGMDEKQFTIYPKQLTWNQGTVDAKTYDGTYAAEVDEQPTLVGVETIDESYVEVTNGTPRFSSPGAGPSVSVIVPSGSYYGISGTAAWKYSITVAGQPAFANAAISQRTLTITGVTAVDREFDDTTRVELDFSSASLVNYVAADHPTYIYVDEVNSYGEVPDENAEDDKAVTTVIQLGGAQAENYTLTQPTGITVNIEKVDPIVTWPTATLTLGESLSQAVLSDYDSNTQGIFAFTAGTTTPALSDSESTEYVMTFTPTDMTNFNTLTYNYVRVKVNQVALSNLRAVEEVFTPEGATIGVGTITAPVSNSTTSQVIDVRVSDGADWHLFRDQALTDAITPRNTPIALSVGPNIVYLRVTAENGETQVYTVTITRAQPPVSAPVFVSANRVEVVSGTGGIFPVSATGATSYLLVGAPAGVTINEDTGLITIAATVAVDEYVFTINATNAGGTTPQTFTLIVNDPDEPEPEPEPTAPEITSADNYKVISGTGGAFQITATGTAPIRFTAVGAPAGVSVNTSGFMTIAATVTYGEYKFTIRAENDGGYYVQDFTLTVEPNLEQIIEDIFDGIDFESKDEVDEAVERIIALDTSELAEVMKENPDVAALIAELEDAHTSLYNINVSQTVHTDIADAIGFGSDDVAIVGAGLNVTSGAVVLSILPSQIEDDVHTDYTNAIRFHMTLTGAGIDPKNLDVPVMITIPIPAGMDPDKFRILHFYAGDSDPDAYREIDYQLNGDGTVTFVLASFSEFAFVELASDPVPEPPTLSPTWNQPSSTNDFTDVPNGSWQNEAVSWAAKNEITKGSPAGSVFFKPNDATTRAEFVTFLHRVFGTPDVSATPFSDMPANADFRSAILWARAEGITTGAPASSNIFLPGNDITREQIAVMLYRYLGDLMPASEDVLGDYTDSDKISSWTDAEEAVNWAVYHKLMGQNTNNILNPGGSATRAEAITMIYRAVVAFGITAP
jgi:hypothetical protein